MPGIDNTPKPWDSVSLSLDHGEVATVVLLSHDVDRAEWTGYYYPEVLPSSIVQVVTLSDAAVQSEFSSDGVLNVLYEVKPSKHGLGLFAKMCIPAKRAIIVEEQSITGGLVLETLKQFRLLSDSQNFVMRHMCNAHPPGVGEERLPKNTPPEIRELIQIANTNQFEDAGVFPLLAKANHSCRPNAEFHFFRSGRRNGRAVLRALRPIEAGEEILQNYCEEYSTFAERAAMLKNHGIEHCDCELCTAPVEERQRHDRAVKREELRARCRHLLRVQAAKRRRRDLERRHLAEGKGPPENCSRGKRNR